MIHVMYIFVNSFNVLLNSEQYSSNGCSFDYKTKVLIFSRLFKPLTSCDMKMVLL